MIPGLYATVPCAGGFMNKYYRGSISSAGITGRWAANAATVALGIKSKEDLDAELAAQYEAGLAQHAEVVAARRAEAAAAAKAENTLTGGAEGIGGTFEVYVTLADDGAIAGVEAGENGETQGTARGDRLPPASWASPPPSRSTPWTASAARP